MRVLGDPGGNIGNGDRYVRGGGKRGVFYKTWSSQSLRSFLKARFFRNNL